MKLEDFTKTVKNILPDFNILTSDIIQQKKGMWSWEDLKIKALDTINPDNDIVVERLGMKSSWSKIAYKITLYQNSKEVVSLTNTNLKDLLSSFNNLLEFKRI